MNISFEDPSITPLLHILEESYGIDFNEYAQASFHRRLKYVLDKYDFKNISELITQLESLATFRQLFLDELTVNTTELFRDPTFWKELKKEIHARFSHTEKLRIWSAGTATGEEAISLSILIHELGLEKKVTIIATDINSSVITNNRNRIYENTKKELYQQNYQEFNSLSTIENHIEPSERGFIFHPKFYSIIEFRNHNLTHPTTIDETFDLIVCRNVMIYFGLELQKRVLIAFHYLLNRNGLLAIGSKENILWPTTKPYFSIVNEYERIYKKTF